MKHTLDQSYLHPPSTSLFQSRWAVSLQLYYRFKSKSCWFGQREVLCDHSGTRCRHPAKVLCHHQPNETAQRAYFVHIVTAPWWKGKLWLVLFRSVRDSVCSGGEKHKYFLATELDLIRTFWQTYYDQKHSSGTTATASAIQ